MRSYGNRSTCPALSKRCNAVHDDGRKPCRINGPVDAVTAGKLLDLFNRIFFLAVDRMRCAKLFGKFKPFRNDVDRNHLDASGNSAGHHGCKTNGPRPEDGNRIARLWLERIEYGAGTGHVSASKRTELAQIKL